MTERFTVVYDDIIDLGSIYDSETERFISVGILTRTELICNLLNELNNENHQLKRQIGNLEHTRDFCADVCADCERLEKENKQLKQRNEFLKKQLDRVCDENEIMGDKLKQIGRML